LSGCFDDDGVPDPTTGEWSNGTEFHTNKLTNYVLKEGETLLLVPAAGGGYGDPLERDPESVRLDVWNEKVSLAAAEKVYGVMFDRDTLEIQPEASETLRALLRAERDGGPPPISWFAPWPRTVDEMPVKASHGVGQEVGK
jgi:N-methylhydantoinase B